MSQIGGGGAAGEKGKRLYVKKDQSLCLCVTRKEAPLVAENAGGKGEDKSNRGRRPRGVYPAGDGRAQTKEIRVKEYRKKGTEKRKE